jgi:hypothetical protein
MVPWSQQPEYIKVYQSRTHPQQGAATAMLWAPNYGGGYPEGGQSESKPRALDLKPMDTRTADYYERRPVLPYYPVMRQSD